MNYTLNQLQIFLKIVQTKSVTKASEELHLTQPAVSIQLKNFQEQFDISKTYELQMKYFVEALKSDVKFINDFNNSVEVLKIAICE